MQFNGLRCPIRPTFSHKANSEHRRGRRALSFIHHQINDIPIRCIHSIAAIQAPDRRRGRLRIADNLRIKGPVLRLNHFQKMNRFRHSRIVRMSQGVGVQLRERSACRVSMAQCILSADSLRITADRVHFKFILNPIHDQVVSM